MIPTITQRCNRCFGVLVITLHHIHTLYENFTYDLLRIRTINADFHTRYGKTARCSAVFLPVSVRDDGRTLCSTVTYGDGETYLLKELLYFTVEGSTTHDYFVDISAKGIHELLTHLAQNLILHNGECKQKFHAGCRKFWQHILLDNLFNNQGHGYYDARFDFAKRLKDNLGRGNACEEEDVATVDELEEEFKRHTIHMRHGEH